ncbi:MAG: preprotein translocase subunit SecY, partial [Anaerolineae bacterium]
MLQAVRNAFLLPDLRRKIIFTLLILVVYRIASQVPVPGVDREMLSQFLAGNSAGAGIFQFLDLLSGGVLSRFSVLATGVYPYITASIILQLLTP